MTRMRVLICAAELSLLYNIMLLLSVTMDYEWATTRAAGGQFDTFPISIRILYFFMAAFMGALMFWVWDKREGINTLRSQRFSNALVLLFSLSTFMQLISRSSDERWNAIPAIILAITFYKIRNSNKRGD